MAAYAIALTENNIRGVIISEAGPGFNVDLALQWFKDHEEGWFIRDPESPLDCAFIMPEVFGEIYMFVSDDQSSLIRRIVKI